MFFEKWFKKEIKKDDKKEEVTEKQELPKEKNTPKIVITIGREMGSGGRKVGRILAEKLDIPFYDKQVITDAAKENGIDEDLFKQVDEANLDSFWYEFSTDAYQKDESEKSFVEMTAADKLFMIQSDTIRRIAEKHSAVIVGRCSTYILKNNSIKVFITADEKDRIARIMRFYKVDEEQAKKIMKISDKKRENYHSYYTNQNWKEKNNYDLYLNTTELGIEGAVNKIIKFVNKTK